MNIIICYNLIYYPWSYLESPDRGYTGHRTNYNTVCYSSTFPLMCGLYGKKNQNRGLIIAWISYCISESASFVPAHLQYVTVGLRFTSIPAPSSSCLSHSDCISRYDLSSYIYISVNPHHTHTVFSAWSLPLKDLTPPASFLKKIHKVKLGKAVASSSDRKCI